MDLKRKSTHKPRKKSTNYLERRDDGTFEIDDDYVLKVKHYEDYDFDHEDFDKGPNTLQNGNFDCQNEDISYEQPIKKTPMRGIEFVSPDDSLELKQAKIKHRRKKTGLRLKKHKSKDILDSSDNGNDNSFLTNKDTFSAPTNADLTSGTSKERIDKILKTNEAIVQMDQAISGLGKVLKSDKIPDTGHEEITAPIIIDRTVSPETKCDIDLEKSSYWKGIPLKIFQNKDIASLLKLSEKYIIQELFINPTFALSQYILYNDDKLKHLPYLAGKTLAYSSDLGKFQAQALVDAFNVCDFRATDVKEYYKNNLHCPTDPPFWEKALNCLLSSSNNTSHHIEEIQGIQLIHKFGGPIYSNLY
mgnify:CR=1 FL=1